ncbi:MAG: 3-deoxy-D-manno-octulosonate 8-phosphate phosphatase [Candidatus Electrothrix sp. AR3]|nr:3-deoxy-D-manno-octulosonate 8-phosphate phosphatase [Candidatus Electrothrix sp. AR3]
MADCLSGAGGYSDCNLTQALRERAREREQPMLRSAAWKSTLIRAKKVQLLLLDVDGVLTDGSLLYSLDGGESKRFHTQDGFGLRILQEAGIAVGLITARCSEVVQRRAKELKIEHIYTGCPDKGRIYSEILAQTGYRSEQTAFMGDDWLDLPVLLRVGCSFAPANAVPEVRQRVDYVTEQAGGFGAVREACELILEARGELAAKLVKYTQGISC